MKTIIKIVRIENPKDGKGFFNSKNKDGRRIRFNHSKHDDINSRHLNWEKFPNYYDDYELSDQVDKIEANINDYKFAFKTLDQLREAFTNEELKECIEKLGFKILLLSVDDYFQSPYQVVFRNPLETEDISSLFI